MPFLWQSDEQYATIKEQRVKHNARCLILQSWLVVQPHQMVSVTLPPWVVQSLRIQLQGGIVMDRASGRLTVLFEDPFWVGVFERTVEGTLSACKVTFGAEPKDCEVYDFILKRYHQLRFSPAVATATPKASRNPKRIRREARKQVQNAGIGTKSQQALKLQQEQGKMLRKAESRAQRQAELRRRFALKQQKKKEKHRGR